MRRPWSSPRRCADRPRPTRRTRAQLAEKIEAPAVGGTVPEGAGVHSAGLHGIEEQPARDRHWARTVGGRSVAKLPGVVRAPAVGGAARGERTREESWARVQ